MLGLSAVTLACWSLQKNMYEPRARLGRHPRSFRFNLLAALLAEVALRLREAEAFDEPRLPPRADARAVAMFASF